MVGRHQRIGDLDEKVANLSATGQLPELIRSNTSMRINQKIRLIKRHSTFQWKNYDSEDGEFQAAVNRLQHGSEGVIASMARQLDENKDKFLKKWKKDVTNTRAFMKNLNRGLLNPRGKFVERWDLATAMFLLFTAIVTPFEVCFLYDPIVPVTAQQISLFVANQIVNGFFVLDIAVNFFLPYQKIPGQHERRRKMIALNYLRSWFIPDFVSIIPFDWFAIGGLFGDHTTIPKFALRMPRTAKLLRLVKLLRILKASRLISRWESKISVSQATRTVIFWLGIIMFCMHIMASFWGFLPQLMGSLRGYLDEHEVAECGCLPAGSGPLPGNPPESVLDEDRCSTDCLTECELTKLALKWRMTVDAVANQEHWLCRYRNTGHVYYHYQLRPFSIYMTCAFQATQFFAGGTGEISPQNDPENVMVFIFVVTGTMLWAIFVGAVCSIQTNIDEAERQYMVSAATVMANFLSLAALRLLSATLVHVCVRTRGRATGNNGQSQLHDAGRGR